MWSVNAEDRAIPNRMDGICTYFAEKSYTVAFNSYYVAFIIEDPKVQFQAELDSRSCQEFAH